MDRPPVQGLGVDVARLAASALLHNESADGTEEIGISSSGGFPVLSNFDDRIAVG